MVPSLALGGVPGLAAVTSEVVDEAAGRLAGEWIVRARRRCSADALTSLVGHAAAGALQGLGVRTLAHLLKFDAALLQEELADAAGTGAGAGAGAGVGVPTLAEVEAWQRAARVDLGQRPWLAGKAP